MKNTDVRREREARRRQGYREVILHAAERVICRKGFSALTMNDVAREAQLSKATVYKYIAGKGVLLFEILAHYFDDMAGRVDEVLAGPGTAVEKLRLAIRLIIQEQESKSYVTRILWMDKAMLKLMHVYVEAGGKPGSMPAADRKRVAVLQGKMERIAQMASRIFEEGVASGEFRALDARRASVFMQAVVEGYAHNRFWGGDGPLSPDAVDVLTQFILEGIRNPEPAGKEK
ncbi:MAG TPA: TetR/AcrR family transcriptional regulator [Candidatus Aminicenantes bacterium]|nr:TetR/AcrR family transcriptional regulator [Candidatus Aminicenantes bacterium]HRY63982.1 TetR/AcrR family transcriptional regulator [Candidatus Aminicenantes bacterium]HRZ70895.1 TetR/AcrR family transcriptional regulator [Candidatus Aminicenantes bacterium]